MEKLEGFLSLRDVTSIWDLPEKCLKIKLTLFLILRAGCPEIKNLNLKHRAKLVENMYFIYITRQPNS